VFTARYGLGINSYSGLGKAMSQAVSRQALAVGGGVKFQVVPCEICDGQSGTGIFFTECFNFPCHYHSTDAPSSSQVALPRRRNGRSLHKAMFFRTTRRRRSSGQSSMASLFRGLCLQSLVFHVVHLKTWRLQQIFAQAVTNFPVYSNLAYVWWWWWCAARRLCLR